MTGDQGWDEVNTVLMQAFDSGAGGLFMHDEETLAFTNVSLQGIPGDLVALYEEHIAPRNPWAVVPGLMTPGRVLTDQTLEDFHKNKEAYTKTAFHADWSARFGMRHWIGGTLVCLGGRHINYTLARSAAQGPFEDRDVARFQGVMEQLQTVVGLSASMKVAHARKGAAERALELNRHAVFLLGADGEILFQNAAAQSLIGRRDGVETRGRHVKLSRSRCDARFRTALRQALQTARAMEGQDEEPAGPPAIVHAVRPSGRFPYQIQVSPLPLGGGFLEDLGPRLVVVIHDPATESRLSAEYLSVVYSLTEREIEVAQLFVNGADAAAIAGRLSLSVESVRQYLKNIMKKIGVNRQTDLLRFLFNISSPGALGE